MPLGSLIWLGLGLLVAIFAVSIVILFKLGRRVAVPPEFSSRVQEIREQLERSDRALGDQFARDREEAAASGKRLRDDVTAGFVTLSDSLRKSLVDLAQTQNAQLDGFGQTLNSLKAESASNAKALREEMIQLLKQFGEAVNSTITRLSQAQGQKLEDVTKQVRVLTGDNEARQEKLRQGVDVRLSDIRKETADNAVQLREEVVKSLAGTGELLRQNLTAMSESQRERLNAVSQQLEQLIEQQHVRQEALRKSVEDRLDALREENAAKLEQMRVTVDEKLQGTLQERLGASFDQVSKQLEQVHKGVGEMQALAAGVGDLKRVLTNVKMRGTWGEVSLGNLLEQVMAADQFARNVEIRPASGFRVEFAIKLPGLGESEAGAPVWLPIDSKFPSEDYERLVNASERGDLEGVEAAGAAIESRIRGEAREMCAKYVCPPHSTDFGVLFLPTEGLYAEVIRRPGLIDALQREHRLIVTGPTTLAALLNSLRMGFRTLAIQKRSSEVWQILGAVKTEFRKYGDVLDKVKKKLEQATNEIDNAAVRQRQVTRALTKVETIPELQASTVLELPLMGAASADETT